MKGLTNHDLAKHLNWDDRTVTNALQSDRPLRLPTAESILKTATKLGPRRNGLMLAAKEALAINKKAIKILAPSLTALANLQTRLWPAALIASSDVDILAECLTDAIVRRSGFSENKRRVIERAIADALMADAANFTFAAKQRLTNKYGLRPAFTDDAAMHILARFGYHIRP